MIKIKKKLLVIFSFILLFFNLSVLATINHTKEFYINDYAQVLNDETKQYILNNSNALNENTKAQIVVLTVNSLEEKDINEYGIEIFRNWEIGDKNLNNGLLIVLSTGDRKIRIEVGTGLEGRVNDSKAGRFIDEYSIPSLKNNDWDTGIKNLYSALLNEVYQEYNMETPSEVSNILTDFENQYKTNDSDINLIIIILLIIFIGVPILLPFIFRKKYSDFYNNNDHHDGFGGGGFFGGGGSNGGGFGGFGGGGGSAGGGGASRGF